MSGEPAASGDTTTTEASNTETTESQSNDKTFTQAEVDAMLAERASRAERAAANRIAEALGGRKPEDAATMLREYEELKQSQMSETEKVQAQAAEAIRRAEALEAEAQRAIEANAIRTALFRPAEGNPVQVDLVDDGVELVRARMARDTEMTVEAAVAAVQAGIPALFGNPSGSNQQGTRTPPPAGRTASERGGATGPSAEKTAAGLVETFLARSRGRDRNDATS